MNKSAKEKIYDTNRWGLNSEAVAELGNHLHRFWKRFTDKFKTKTRNVAVHALFYMKGLLLMEKNRNYANLSRRVVDPIDDGQKIQHFMSDSPWSSEAVIKQVQEEIKETAGLEQGYLLLDESADEKAGDKSAGAGRQHNGRLGKIEMSQVGVFLAYFKDTVWNWIDGELYIPENWFKKEMESNRKSAGIPKERKFATKVQLGWQMIERVKQRGLKFKALACDDLYGRSGWLRKNMSEAGIVYMAEVPENTFVYLSKPDYRVPSVSESQKGRKLKRAKILNDVTPLKASELAKESASDFERILVRSTERGDLNDGFLVRRVWTIREKELAEEWLIIRHEYGKKYTYALSNADKDTPKKELAKLKCVRHFIERANQDIKSEIGWDELEARKYQAWYHHLAMTIMSMWFISQQKHEWVNKYPRDSKLSEELKVKSLPALSVANVRELLKAVMPLQQLTPEQATSLVVSHLVNRSYSTASRLKAQANIQASG
jgi:SRSO17 transposase